MKVARTPQRGGETADIARIKSGQDELGGRYYGHMFWHYWPLVRGIHQWHFDGLVQERRNSSALAMELCLSCTNSLIYDHKSVLLALCEENHWWQYRLSFCIIGLFWGESTCVTIDHKSALLGLYEGNPPVIGGFPSQRDNNVESFSHHGGNFHMDKTKPQYAD